VGAAEGELQVLLTSARDRQGIGELADALLAHRLQLGASGVLARRGQGRLAWALDWLARRVGSLGIEALGGLPALRVTLEEASARGEPTLRAAQQLADRLVVQTR
jgi:hypothetical protein